jgi:hypothetical protein
MNKPNNDDIISRNDCTPTGDATLPVSLTVWYNIEKDKIVQEPIDTQIRVVRKILNTLVSICSVLINACGLLLAIIASWMCFVSIYGSLMIVMMFLYLLSQFTVGIMIKPNYTLFEKNIIFITWQQIILRIPLQ